MITAYQIQQDAVRVAGPEALTYLQGQLSQDVEHLEVGASAWSFVLQPTGKVDSWGRAVRTGDEEVVLVVDGGHGPALAARLQRFLLRTKAAVEQVDWGCVALRGPGAGEGARALAGGAVVVDAGWPAVEGADLLGPDVVPPDGVPVGPVEDFEGLRIVSGIPRLGAELTEKTIPAEMGQQIIDGSVSFTKGCFTGQELVARIDSRGGNVPRQLRGLILEGDPDGGEVPAPGAALDVGGSEAGTVTSVAVSPRLEATVALALVRRAVEVPADGLVRWDGGEVKVRVAPLPLDLAR